MIPSQNILYIGPYKEESNRGYYSYVNIKALEKAGHRLKIIPLYSHKYLVNKISEDISHLENNNLERYDICIQHCDPIQYCFHNHFKKNIGIYDFANFDPHPIINTQFLFLDKIVVSSQNKLEILSDVVSAALYSKLAYVPQLIDLNHVQHEDKGKDLGWLDEKRFYFYSELNFSEQYDWEKLIYVYLTSFMNKKTGLIIRTKQLDTEEKIKLIKKQIYDMAKEAKIKHIPEAMPQVLNGIPSDKDLTQVYQRSHCLIDVNKANEQSYSSVYFAALNKPIICNSHLTAASYFKNAYKVAGLVCNSSMTYYHDIANSSMTNYYYTINTEHLRETMQAVYNTRYNKHRYYDDEINQYNISNINNLL